MDVKMTFLNGELDVETHVEQMALNFNEMRIMCVV